LTLPYDSNVTQDLLYPVLVSKETQAKDFLLICNVDTSLVKRHWLKIFLLLCYVDTALICNADTVLICNADTVYIYAINLQR